MPYLLKTEPSTYSFADLQRDGTTTWDGVKNPFALRNLAAMQPGDEVIIYHTGDEKQAVGTARVEKVDASDPHDPKVKISSGKPLQPVTLAQMKANSHFAGSPLVRQGRLSVVPLTAAQHRFILNGGK
jgi:predicted RNA-binding protein with PUA-like domain